MVCFCIQRQCSLCMYIREIYLSAIAQTMPTTALPLHAACKQALKYQARGACLLSCVNKWALSSTQSFPRPPKQEARSSGHTQHNRWQLWKPLTRLAVSSRAAAAGRDACCLRDCVVAAAMQTNIGVHSCYTNSVQSLSRPAKHHIETIAHHTHVVAADFNHVRGWRCRVSGIIDPGI